MFILFLSQFFFINSKNTLVKCARLNAQEFFSDSRELSLISSNLYVLYHIHEMMILFLNAASYRFNCMCLQFYFTVEFSSCYSFLTSASLWLSHSLTLLLASVPVCVCLYDDFRYYFSGVIFFFFWNFGKINICSSTSVQWIFVYFFFFNNVSYVYIFFLLSAPI